MMFTISYCSILLNPIDFSCVFPELLTLNFMRDEHAMFIVAHKAEESEEAAEEQADKRVLK